MASQLKDVFDRCFKMSQNQCVLLLGNRTNSVTKMISEVSKPYQCAVLTLSGLLITDDLHALQCLAIQIANITSTVYTEGNFQSTLNFIKSSLSPTWKMIISIYDIQELAHRNLKQILLYTLFELVHEDICMMCVIGVTNRLDFIEMLEKRIKSRFSYQSIMMIDVELLENLIAGVELEEYNTRAIQQLKPLHMLVLICYIRSALKNRDITQVTAFKEYEAFKNKSPMIVYDVDKFTFSILTSYLMKNCLLKVSKRHAIPRFTIYQLNFDPNNVIYAIKKDMIEVPTALQEWVMEV
ncbi:hypothetical protein SteCoe_24099 [Stentor coeruleus]|uniref:Origin recognition complex subunit 4 C-terminal domain-containing protein n=1 Tax=Stentor coeruleus TaxID=5963 RepID=A0A1R2BIB8_9CILI|nr:hypothetical protein SteCoe_24099 [Stentor coeruleus]